MRGPAQGSAPDTMAIPCPGVNPVVPVTPEGTRLLDAMMAVGSTLPEAVGAVAATLGWQAALPVVEGMLRPGKDGSMLMDVLTHAAQSCPAESRAWLYETIAQGCLGGWHTDFAGLDKGIHLDGDAMAWALPLPPGLVVHENFHVLRQASVRNLPPGMKVEGSLSLAGCRHLACLPDDLEVGRGLFLSGCASLQCLPDGLRVHGGLLLDNCSALESLPDGLWVGGTLDLRGCASLKRLPHGLRVGGQIRLHGCPAWDGVIPEDANVRSEIQGDGIPHGMFQSGWRTWKASNRFTG